MPPKKLKSVKKNKVALKAPVTTPLVSGFRSVNVSLRQALNLYACVRPCKYYRGVYSSPKDPESVDIAAVRENTEDLYGGIESDKGREEAKTALILSGILMLRHIREFEAAERLEKAVTAVIEEGEDVTYDLKRPWDHFPAVGTREMADAIIRRIRSDEDG